VIYLRYAGENAMHRGAHQEASAYFEQALAALQHLPEHRETQEQAIDLRFALRNALLPLEAHPRILDLLREAQPLAEALDDDARLGRVYVYQGRSLALLGSDDEALKALECAHTLADSSGDVVLQIMSASRLGVLYHTRTAYQQSIAIFRQTLSSLEGLNPYERFGGVMPPAVFSHFYLGECLAEMGAFAEALGHAEEALRMAEAIAQPWAAAFAQRSIGHIYLRKGDSPTRFRHSRAPVSSARPETTTLAQPGS
jgi:tetratricopeptide (TPR) repeat protein